MVDAHDTAVGTTKQTAFTTVDRAQWREKLERDLKGKGEEALVWEDVSGFRVNPLYDRLDGSDQGRIGRPGTSWQICVAVELEAFDAASSAIETAARGGAEAVEFVFSESKDSTVGGRLSAQEFGSLCAGARSLGLEIHLAPGAASLAVKGSLSQLTTLGIDPCGTMARGAPTAVVSSLSDLGLELFASETCNGIPFAVDSRFYHGAGASHATELGVSLASGVHLLRAAHERDVEPDHLASFMEVHLALGTDFFASIAKLRAARLCWMRVGEALDVDGSLLIHASPSVLHQTARGRWINTLRNTAYCFAGSVGGADRMTLPSHEFNVVHDRPLAERIARNTQHVLRLESGLDQVSDAAAGSYYLESLTNGTAIKAWRTFQDIEEQGGLPEALESGWLQTTIRKERERRLRDIRSGDVPVLGVSLYPVPDDDPGFDGGLSA